MLSSADIEDYKEELTTARRELILQNNSAGLENHIKKHGWDSDICRIIAAIGKISMLQHFHTKYCMAHKRIIPTYPTAAEINQIKHLCEHWNDLPYDAATRELLILMKINISSVAIAQIMHVWNSPDFGHLIYILRAESAERENKHLNCGHELYVSCENALLHGRLDSYNFLARSKCVPPPNPLIFAAKSGCLTALRKFATYPFTREICQDIFTRGDLECIKFVIENKKPWDENMITSLLDDDKFAVIEYLGMNGLIPLPDKFISAAIETRAIDSLEILYSLVASKK